MMAETITRSQFLMLIGRYPDMLPAMQLGLQNGSLKVIEDSDEEGAK